MPSKTFFNCQNKNTFQRLVNLYSYYDQPIVQDQVLTWWLNGIIKRLTFNDVVDLIAGELGIFPL